MKIQNIGIICTFLGLLFFIFLKLLNIETTGATAIIFFGLGVNIGSLAINNGGM